MRISDWSSDVCSSDLRGLGDLWCVCSLDAFDVALTFAVERNACGLGEVKAHGVFHRRGLALAKQGVLLLEALQLAIGRERYAGERGVDAAGRGLMRRAVVEDGKGVG